MTKQRVESSSRPPDSRKDAPYLPCSLCCSLIQTLGVCRRCSFPFRFRFHIHFRFHMQVLLSEGCPARWQLLQDRLESVCPTETSTVPLWRRGPRGPGGRTPFPYFLLVVAAPDCPGILHGKCFSCEPGSALGAIGSLQVLAPDCGGILHGLYLSCEPSPTPVEAVSLTVQAWRARGCCVWWRCLPLTVWASFTASAFHVDRLRWGSSAACRCWHQTGRTTSMAGASHASTLGNRGWGDAVPSLLNRKGPCSLWKVFAPGCRGILCGECC